MALKSRVIKTQEVNWQEFQFIQQDNFKDLSAEAMHKLKASILSDSFIQPYYVWENPDGVIYCLDGKHRNLALKELIQEGVEVPYLLPATFIHSLQNMN
jgi:ParB-like chromosome segregation protein Spo0J